MNWRRWLGRVIVTLALAGVLHVAIVMAIPYVVTGVFISRSVARFGVNHAVAPPLPTDQARTVVKPSPDLLYAVCIYDVSQGPVRVTLAPPRSYWSLSLFDRNSDNIFRANASDLPGESVTLTLVAQKDAVEHRLPQKDLVVVPHARGVLLARFLVLDASSMPAALAAQRSVTCTPATGQRTSS